MIVASAALPKPDPGELRKEQQVLAVAYVASQPSPTGRVSNFTPLVI
jgi:hypothetical protein